jgi:hypothetical protein
MATIQGVPAQVGYAGPHSVYEGLDQLNVAIPPQLAGFGVLNVRLFVNGRPSNVVTIKIAGEPPLIETQPIASGQTVSGQLTPDDQVALDERTGLTFFFDAYRFHAAPNTSVVADLRSAEFDAVVIVYQVGTDGTLTQLAADDQTGGLGNGRYENNNALLLTVLPAEADYLLLVTTADEDPDGVGSYTLKFVTNLIPQLSYGANLTNASIATTDIQSSVGYYLDAYWFAGAQGDRVRITMSSAAFNPYLILNQRNGNFVDEDDNSGGGPLGWDAQITLASLPTRTLPETGVYLIIATPLEVNRSGNYTLTLTRTGSGLAAAEALAPVGPTLPGREWRDEGRRRGSAFERFATRRVLRRKQ